MARPTPVQLPPFQAVYDAHRDVVWRFIVSVVGRADADDVFQETWLAALRAYADLRDVDRLRAWVMTIAHRKAIDEHRDRARRPTPAPTIGDDVPGDSGPDAYDGDDPLWQQVRALPAKQRAAVAHRFVADLSYADIGAAMNTTPDAARRNVHEAITKLRSTWSP
ncbi:MAG TPA: sigma-70 family RNA polymerase sigma factor [Mycobacteriales bacterium]|nr:sigma-70 family RNA polymerase sigma factor [Mycobacteriales bacterium]